MNGTDTPSARAWSTPRTCRTLVWTTVRALVVLGLGLACLPGLAYFVDVAETARGRAEKNADSMAMLCLFAFLPITITGLVMIWTAIRRWRAGSQRWQVVSVQRYRSGLREWVQLIDPHDQLLGTLKLRRWISASGYRDGTLLWFAGDPRKAGLVARPGGTRTLFAYQAPWYPAPRFGRALIAGAEATAHPPRAARPRAQATPPPPPLRGGRDDETFPSPRMLRRSFAFGLDLMVHLAVGVGVAVFADPVNREAVAQQQWGVVHVDWIVVVGCFVLASFVDRVLVQAFTHTTLGKALFGLVVIDRDTGRYPRFRWLLATWLVSGLLAIQLPFAVLALDAVGPERPERYLLPAVRRHDARQVFGTRSGDPVGGTVAH